MKNGSVHLRSAAFQRVRDGLRGAPKVRDVEVALRIQYLRVPHRDNRSCGTAHAEPDAPDHVLPHVEDRLAARRANDLLGFEFNGAAHGRASGSDEDVLGLLDRCHAAPLGVGESGTAPAGSFEPGVVGLALVDAGHQDGTSRCLPRRAGGHDLAAAVLVGNLDLRDGREAIAVDVAVAVPRERAPVPAVAEHDAGGVVAGREQFCHVVRLVLQPRVVARPTRREHLVTDRAAVDLQLVEPEAADVGAGGGDRPGELEVGAQHRRRLQLGRVGSCLRRDPLRHPVRRLEQAHLEPRGRAPRRGLAGPIPDPDLPVVAVARLERRAVVGALDRGVGRHAPGRPKRPLCEGGLGRGEADLIGRLHDAARLRNELPAEARLARVDAERVLLVLGAQSGHLRGGRGRAGGPSRGGDQDDDAEEQQGQARTRLRRAHVRYLARGGRMVTNVTSLGNLFVARGRQDYASVTLR